MGAYISLQTCKKHYGIEPRCGIKYSYDGRIAVESFGGVRRGEFAGDGDIAGVGIFGTFLAVTSLAVFLALIVIILEAFKQKTGPSSSPNRHADSFRPTTVRSTPRAILQAIITSCSDSQIFIGAAYAVTLRYSRGCSLSAYHYNLVADMMLLTCATHLVALTVARDRQRHPLAGILRMLCQIAMFIITGLLLANQDAEADGPFPTAVPPSGTHDSLLLLSAVCFQSKDPSLQMTMGGTSRTHHMRGWHKYLVLLVWYSVAALVEMATSIRRRSGRSSFCRAVSRPFRSVAIYMAKQADGKSTTRSTVAQETVEDFDEKNSRRPFADTTDERAACRIKRASQYASALFSIAGVAICMWTVVECGLYISKLRRWVQKSGWLALDASGRNAENEATSFGQLVPILTSGLILFTLFEMCSGVKTERRDVRDMRLEEEDTDVSPETPHVQFPKSEPHHDLESQLQSPSIVVSGYGPAVRPSERQFGTPSYFPQDSQSTGLGLLPAMPNQPISPLVTPWPVVVSPVTEAAAPQQQEEQQREQQQQPESQQQPQPESQSHTPHELEAVAELEPERPLRRTRTLGAQSRFREETNTTDEDSSDSEPRGRRKRSIRGFR